MSELVETLDLEDLVRRECAALNIAHEAQWIIAHCRAGADGVARARHVLALRAQGFPLAYVFGSWAFREYELAVGPGALIPRPETEELVELALEQALPIYLSHRGATPFRIYDLGAGTGCVGLTFALDLVRRALARGGDAPLAPVELTLVERSSEARVYLEKNVETFRRGANRGAEAEAAARRVTIDVAAGDWNPALAKVHSGTVEVLLSNPPYLNHQEWIDDAESSVREFEPYEALVPDRDRDTALSPYLEVARVAERIMSPEGFIAFEIGPTQASRFDALSEAFGPAFIGTMHRDLSTKNRFLVFTRISRARLADGVR